MARRSQQLTPMAKKIKLSLERTMPARLRFKLYKARVHDGKQCFTESYARKVAARMSEQFAPDMFAAYQCPIRECQKWHVGNDKNAQERSPEK